MNEKTMDMTKGSIMPKLIRFALPVLLGMLFQRIYNFADVYIVGKFLGDDALAALPRAPPLRDARPHTRGRAKVDRGRRPPHLRPARAARSAESAGALPRRGR